MFPRFACWQSCTEDLLSVRETDTFVHLSLKTAETELAVMQQCIVWTWHDAKNTYITTHWSVKEIIQRGYKTKLADWGRMWPKSASATVDTSLHVIEPLVGINYWDMPSAGHQLITDRHCQTYKLGVVHAGGYACKYSPLAPLSGNSYLACHHSFCSCAFRTNNFVVLVSVGICALKFLHH